MKLPVGSPSPGWQVFAWQGFRVEVPVEWNPTLLKGSAKEGYCRLDDAVGPRLELRWQRLASGRPPSEVVDKYLAEAARKRRGPTSTVRRNTRLVAPPGMESETFEWRAEKSAVGLAAHCAECGRLTIARVLFSEEAPDRSLARRVLRTYQDHDAGDQRLWSVYGLAFSMPAAYGLDEYAFAPGRIAIRLAAARCEALAVRFGVADVWLRHKSLPDRLRSDEAAREWSRKTRFVETSVNQHEGVEAEIIPARPFLRWFRRGRRRVRAWRCPQTNAAFLAQWQGPAGRSEEFDDFVKSFRCHDPSIRQSSAQVSE